MMEGLTRKDDGLEAAMKSMAESSALLNKTLPTGLQFMFSAMRRPGNIRYQSSNPPGFTANNWFNQSQFPPFTPTHTCQPPGNIQSNTILTLMGTLIGNIMSEYLRVSNVEVLLWGIQQVRTFKD